MLITKKSILSGNVNQMHLNITQEQIDEWAAGSLIQNVFPNLNGDEREFLMTGVTPGEWDATFPLEDE